MTSFRFVRHRGGISAFAAVALEPAADASEAVEWMPEVQSLEAIYGEAVLSGIADALAWHMLEGGGSTAFRVLELTELLVDTKPDAVRCAATMAAWKALGHDESGIAFEFEHEWRARRTS